MAQQSDNREGGCPSDETHVTAATSDVASRRRFLSGGLSSTVLFGLGAALGFGGKTSGGAQSRAAVTPSGGRSASSLGPEFGYDLSALRRIDPALLHYEEVRVVTTGLKQVQGITVDPQGNLLAAGDQSVRRFDGQGKQLGEIRLSQAPRCVAVGEDGTLAVGLTDQVVVFGPGDPAGRSWPKLGARSLISSLALSASHVFVADAGHRIVRRCNPDGKETAQIGRKDSARHVPGFILPSPHLDLALGSNQVLWVNNPGRHRIEAYTMEGDFLEGWGETSNQVRGFCGCCNPAHFALLPDGRFVTSEKGLTRVKVYSVDGQLQSVVAGPDQFPRISLNPGGAQVALDVAADREGRIYVADTLAGSVRIFQRKKTS